MKKRFFLASILALSSTFTLAGGKGPKRHHYFYGNSPLSEAEIVLVGEIHSSSESIENQMSYLMDAIRPDDILIHEGLRSDRVIKSSKKHPYKETNGYGIKLIFKPKSPDFEGNFIVTGFESESFEKEILPQILTNNKVKAFSGLINMAVPKTSVGSYLTEINQKLESNITKQALEPRTAQLADKIAETKKQIRSPQKIYVVVGMIHLLDQRLKQTLEEFKYAVYVPETFEAVSLYFKNPRYIDFMMTEAESLKNSTHQAPLLKIAVPERGFLEIDSRYFVLGRFAQPGSWVYLTDYLEESIGLDQLQAAGLKSWTDYKVEAVTRVD